MNQFIHSFKDKIFNVLTNEEFEQLALRLFHFQVNNNSVYSEYVKALNISNPSCINEIPFLPISFFKTHKVLIKNTNCKNFFKSSGTTSDLKSKHYVPDVELYEKSFIKNFMNHYGEIDQYCVLALLPDLQEQPNSSLVYMMNRLVKLSSHSSSGFYLNNFNELFLLLKKLEKENQKTILLGLSYALLDFLDEYQLSLLNTIIVETGGVKGKREELTKDELHMHIKNAFGVSDVHSEYGMTELLSQAYSSSEGWFQTPSWMKVLIRSTTDPFSLIENNKKGLINVIDLANIYSCAFIATDDLGMSIKNQFKVLGRYDYADMRGCNLMI